MHNKIVNQHTKRKSARAVYADILAEISLIRRVLSPNVVQLYGVAFKDLSPVLVVEDGLFDLEHYVESEAAMGHPVEQTVKLRLCRDVCSGLQALDEAGIVHGNLRAEHITLVESIPGGPLTAKIADFGSPFGVPSEGADTGDAMLFVAPEKMYTFGIKFPALRKREQSSEQDVFGFGMLLWQVTMDGELPYADEIGPRLRAIEVEEKRLEDFNLEALMKKLPDDTNPELVNIIRNATKLIPSERATLDELDNSLRILLNNLRISFEEVDE